MKLKECSPDFRLSLWIFKNFSFDDQRLGLAVMHQAGIKWMDIGPGPFWFSIPNIKKYKKLNCNIVLCLCPHKIYETLKCLVNTTAYLVQS